MTTPRQRLGQLGEDAAAARLTAQGWQIVARNWRTRRGEIDIIAQDRDWLVFVEVRARRAPTAGSPEESVTPRKQLQLAHMAEEYLFELRWPGPWRADVIAIEFDPRDQITRYAHYQDAISG